MERRESAALISIGVNMLLVVLKLTGAVLSGSLALLADAWHSSSDIAVSLLVWVGIKLSVKDAGRPREEGGIENSIAIIISLAIFYAAFAVARKAVTAVTYQIRYIPVAMVITLACIFISLFISRYKIYVGKATNSPSLVADGQHSRMDMYTSIGVLVVLVGSMIGVGLDKLVAVIIALLIMKVGYDVLILAVQGLRRGELLRFQPSGILGERVSPAIPVVKKLFQLTVRLNEIIRKRGRILCALVVVLVLVCYLWTGFSVVGPAERGLIKKFGKFVGDVKSPGLYYHWPYPIERMVKMKPERVRRLEFGFRTNPAYASFKEPLIYEWESRHLTGHYRKDIGEALMLTGDENIIDMNLILHYRIKDMKEYLINVSNIDELIRVVTEAAVRLVVGEDELDDIITLDRGEVQNRIRGEVQGRLDRLGVGVAVVRIFLQDVHPPIEVVKAFRDVASAREDKSRLINKAKAQQNDAIPRARGTAARELMNAEAFKIAEAVRARGDASSYLSILSAYQEAPRITRFRLVWEALEKALKPVEKFFLSPEETGTVQLWLLPAGQRRGEQSGASDQSMVLEE
jgi:membrane protease subunit HflK